MRIKKSFNIAVEAFVLRIEGVLEAGIEPARPKTLICVKVKVVFTNGNPGCGVAAEGISYQGFDGINSIGADDYVYLDVCPDSVFELQSCFPLCIPCPERVYATIIVLTTITTPPGPDGCIDLGTWTIVN